MPSTRRGEGKVAAGDDQAILDPMTLAVLMVMTPFEEAFRSF